MHLLSKLKFGSYLSYTNHTEHPEAENSRRVQKAVKNYIQLKNPPLSVTKKIIKDMVSEQARLPFANYFEENTLLVAVPGHAISSSNTFWLTYRIAKEMESSGLGIASNCLKRITRIRKSAFCKPSERPSAQEHTKTMKCVPTLHTPSTIILVDDIITSGCTLLASASVLKKQFPNSTIMGFALIRYENTLEKFKGIKDPKVGTITLRPNGLTRRIP